MRLVVLVEGQTEEAFVNDLLIPHLSALGVYSSATIVGTPARRGSAPLRKGGGSWQKWFRDLQRVSQEQKGADVRITTLFDLYGLPVGFPGLKEHASDADMNRRCEILQAALADKVGDWRLIPYIQRHEFEALVLASLPALEELLDAEDDLEGLAQLQKEIGELAPEDINDGKDTAPSKRLLKHIPGYRKTLHGPLVTYETGLQVLRESCPRFHEWLAQLEELAK